MTITSGPLGRESMSFRDKTPARRIERMQGTLMKLVAQLEEYKMMLNQEKEGEENAGIK